MNRKQWAWFLFWFGTASCVALRVMMMLKPDKESEVTLFFECMSWLVLCYVVKDFWKDF